MGMHSGDSFTGSVFQAFDAPWQAFGCVSVVSEKRDTVPRIRPLQRATRRRGPRRPRSRRA